MRVESAGARVGVCVRGNCLTLQQSLMAVLYVPSPDGVGVYGMGMGCGGGLKDPLGEACVGGVESVRSGVGVIF